MAFYNNGTFSLKFLICEVEIEREIVWDREVRTWRKHLKIMVIKTSLQHNNEMNNFLRQFSKWSTKEKKKKQLYVMLIEDRKKNDLSQNKNKTDSFCNPYQLNSLYLDQTNVNRRIQTYF